MGVTGLWSILSELCERKPLTYLSGKRVAVDLSGWVVQAVQCKPLSASKNPHLRNLFFRVSHLLQNGVHLVFVIEGKPPALKEFAFKKRNHSENRETKNNLSRSKFDQILRQCQDLLDCLGVPCIKSSGEAEALCGFLCLNGIVDGVITEDSDTFLYGANVVFRDFTIDPKDSHVNVYSLKSYKNKFLLDQRKLVALALLLGCDYIKGVPGIGKEAALKLLSAVNGVDILQRFQDWKRLDESKLFPGYLGKKVKKLTHCNRCDHIGSVSVHKKTGCQLCSSTITCYLSSEVSCPCPWHINNEISLKHKAELKIYNAVREMSDFPNSQVIEEYLHYSDQIPDKEALLWKCPNLQNFQEKAFNYLSWTLENSLNKCLPLITFWQICSLCDNVENAQVIFQPTKVIKEKVVKGEECLEILWELKDVENDADFLSENLCTVERLALFSQAYPNIAKSFFDAKTKEKETKIKLKADRQEKRKRPAKDSKSDRKVIQETPHVSPSTLKSNSINFSPHMPDSPSSDSFDSITNVPLSVRVIALSEKMSQKEVKESKLSEEVDALNSNEMCMNSCAVDEKCLPVTGKNVFKHDDSVSKITSYDVITDSFQSQLCFQLSDSDDSFNVILSQNKNLLLSGSKRTLIFGEEFNMMPEKNLTDKILNFQYLDAENIFSDFQCEHEEKLLSKATSVNRKSCEVTGQISTSSCHSFYHNSDKQILNDENLDLSSHCKQTDKLTLRVKNFQALIKETKNDEQFFRYKNSNDSCIDSMSFQISDPSIINKDNHVIINDRSLCKSPYSSEISDLESRITKMKIKNNFFNTNNLIYSPCLESGISPKLLYVLNKSKGFCKTSDSFISSTPNKRLERLKSRNISISFEQSKLYDTPKCVLYSPIIFDSSSNSSMSNGM